MKRGRPRGQRGELIRSGKSQPQWIGRWAVYEGVKKVRRAVTLGDCDTISEAEARRKMLGLIAKTNRQSHAIAAIGGSSRVLQLTKADRLPLAKTGSISELLVCADLMAKGWDLYRAMDATCACDLMCVKAGFMARVEVKTGTIHQGRLLRLHTKPDKFDILALVSGATIRYYAYHQLGDLKNPDLSGSLVEIEQSLTTSLPPEVENIG